MSGISLSARRPRTRDTLRPSIAYGLLAVAAGGYALVALLLALADARAMPEPYLRIDADGYFRWGAVFYAPVIVAAWLLACDVVYVLALGLGHRASFPRILTAMAAAVGIGTLGTLVPDLVTSPLRALGVISEPSWEHSVTAHTGWFVFSWCTIAVYVLLFCVTFPWAVRHATGIRGWRAVAIALTAFAVLQGFEYVFIR